MTVFKQAFRPAFNKEGYAKLTFKGQEIRSITRKETGEVIQLNELTFEVMGAVRGNNQNVKISTGFSYDRENLLGKTLEAMGWVLETKIVTDDEGFDVQEVSEDGDGFEQEEVQVLDFTPIFQSKVGQEYIAKLTKNDKGYWSVDVSTLKPFVKPTVKEVMQNLDPDKAKGAKK